MCRGNSLAYADSWDDNPEADLPPVDLARIGQHLAGMAAAVRHGGALLVDVPRATVHTDSRQSFFHHGQTACGQAVTISETIDTDATHRTRRSIVDMTIATEAYRFQRSSHLIDTREIIPILKRLGFRSVVALPDNGIRDHYESLLAMSYCQPSRTNSASHRGV